MGKHTGNFMTSRSGNGEHGHRVRNPSGKHTSAFRDAIPVLKALDKDENVGRLKLGQIVPKCRRHKTLGAIRFLRWISGGFEVAISCSEGDQFAQVYTELPEFVLAEHEIQFSGDRAFAIG